MSIVSTNSSTNATITSDARARKMVVITIGRTGGPIHHAEARGSDVNTKQRVMAGFRSSAVGARIRSER
jgi:hypothetical protein